MRQTRNFLCTASVPTGSNQPVNLTCSAIDSVQANTYVKSSRHGSHSSSSHHSHSSESKPHNVCENKVGRQQFVLCLEAIDFGYIVMEAEYLYEAANAWVQEEGQAYAASLCAAQACPVKHSHSGSHSSSSSHSHSHSRHASPPAPGTCTLFNWSYVISDRGIVPDTSCSYGKYVIEVIVIAECRCAPRLCGKNKFRRPIVLTSTQCPTEDPNVCDPATGSLATTMQELATAFCAASTCTTEGATCGLSKIDSSPIKTKMVGVNGQQCCEATVEIYGVECACQSGT
jgi:hypothetical protein